VSGEPSKISRKERRYVPYQVIDAVRLTTGKADIEVAGKPEDLRTLLERIRPERPDIRCQPGPTR
jgi:hypothetical protein